MQYFEKPKLEAFMQLAASNVQLKKQGEQTYLQRAIAPFGYSAPEQQFNDKEDYK